MSMRSKHGQDHLHSILLIQLCSSFFLSIILFIIQSQWSGSTRLLFNSFEVSLPQYWQVQYSFNSLFKDISTSSTSFEVESYGIVALRASFIFRNFLTIFPADIVIVFLIDLAKAIARTITFSCTHAYIMMKK